MNITICDDERRFDITAANRIVGQIMSKPDSVIGLSTGRTTHAMHNIVGKLYAEMQFDVSAVTFFGLDEVVGVEPTYAGACCAMLHDELIDALALDDRQLLMLPTKSADFAHDCRSFKEQLRLRGGIDLLILGLGENGHLGFNQPGTPFGQEAWVTCMDPQLECRIRRETATPDDVWLGGVTLGLKDIMQARHIVLVAKGARKAAIVDRMLNGDVSIDCPASILQLHPHCEFLLDKDAATLVDALK